MRVPLSRVKRSDPQSAPAYPNAPDTPGLADTGSDAAPQSGGIPLQAPHGAKTTPATISAPSASPADAQGSGPSVGAISQLPDGGGGAVPVPPTPLAPAPPSGVSPSTVPPAMDTAVLAPAGSVVNDTFGADNNLINSQVLPGSDPRLLKLQGMQDSTLDKILNGPDRNAMALDQYKTWESATNPEFQHAITDATDAAAAHGQIRSGQLTNRYGDLSQQRGLDQLTARNRYMQQALSDSIGDRQTAFGDVSGAADSAAAQGLSGRNEQRGEREYQRSLAEQAIARRIQERQLSDAEQAQAFQQAAARYGLGQSSDPTGAYQNAASTASGNAASSTADIGQLLRLLAMKNAQPAVA